jgi:hypothetical protein
LRASCPPRPARRQGRLRCRCLRDRHWRPTLARHARGLSPLLIVIEDLHWADAVSLEAVRFLLDRLERALRRRQTAYGKTAVQRASASATCLKARSSATDR